VSGDFEQSVLRIIDRYFAGRYAKRYGIVSSWDPVKHLAKVLYQPEGQESGWLPVHTLSAGAGYGHMSGLAVGEQVEVTHQEGEFEAGAVTSRVHSVAAAPPTLQSSEELIRTPWGSYIKLAQNGSVTMVDQTGATATLDGSGNLTATSLASFQATHGATGNYLGIDASGNLTSYLSSTAQQHYVGGNPAKGGTFAAISTPSGPSPYAKARVS
jgi:phage baseplate assembly protein gpV